MRRHRKDTIVLISHFLSSSCCFLQMKPSVTGMQHWKALDGYYTTVLKFDVGKDGNFKGVGHWAGGSGGRQNKIQGRIMGDKIELTRFLEGEHVGKTQLWKGTIDHDTNSASGVWEGTGKEGSFRKGI